MPFSDAGTLTDPDNPDLIYEMKTGMSAKLNFRTAGNAAAVTNAGSPDTRFIVTIEPGVDPESVVELFKFTVEKKSRVITVGMISVGGTKPVELPKQKLSFTKAGDGAYLISPRQPLAPGQYGFVLNRPNPGIGASANVNAGMFSVGGGGK